MPLADRIDRILRSVHEAESEEYKALCDSLRDAAKALHQRDLSPQDEPVAGDLCECRDPGCPHCKGRCSGIGHETLHRVDMEDSTGTRFCVYCAEDAFQAGVYR